MIGFLTQDGSPSRGAEIPATGATSLPAVSDSVEGLSAISPQPATAADDAASLQDTEHLPVEAVDPVEGLSAISPQPATADDAAESEACLGIVAMEESVPPTPCDRALALLRQEFQSDDASTPQEYPDLALKIRRLGVKVNNFRRRKQPPQLLIEGASVLLQQLKDQACKLRHDAATLQDTDQLPVPEVDSVEGLSANSPQPATADDPAGVNQSGAESEACLEIDAMEKSVHPTPCSDSVEGLADDAATLQDTHRLPVPEVDSVEGRSANSPQPATADDLPLALRRLHQEFQSHDASTPEEYAALVLKIDRLGDRVNNLRRRKQPQQLLLDGANELLGQLKAQTCKWREASQRSSPNIDMIVDVVKDSQEHEEGAAEVEKMQDRLMKIARMLVNSTRKKREAHDRTAKVALALLASPAEETAQGALAPAASASAETAKPAPATPVPRACGTPTHRACRQDATGSSQKGSRRSTASRLSEVSETPTLDGYFNKNAKTAQVVAAPETPGPVDHASRATSVVAAQETPGKVDRKKRVKSAAAAQETPDKVVRKNRETSVAAAPETPGKVVRKRPATSAAAAQETPGAVECKLRKKRAA